MNWWYLSFSELDGWRGAVIIQGTSFEDALDNATFRGLNPGGEVRGLQLLAGALELTPMDCRNRLLTKEDFDKYFDGAEEWNGPDERPN
jgi:hypothetical protein